MKTINRITGKIVLFFLIISFFKSAEAQLPGINESIAKHRQGELIIKANPGDQVTVEQLSHEFWFGCAISNSIVGSSMSENDLRQYKEKFLKNFNSALRKMLLSGEIWNG